MKYLLEELEKTFILHHENSIKLNKKHIKQFQENNPEQPLPDHFFDDFSLPLALASLTKAIIQIKEKINY